MKCTIAEYFQIAPVVNYPQEHAYTRITEFKYLTGQQHPKTAIVYEFPRAEGDPYYPVPRPENAALVQAIRSACAGNARTCILSDGSRRISYYNMDQVVAQALTLVAKLHGERRLEVTRDRPAAAQPR